MKYKYINVDVNPIKNFYVYYDKLAKESGFKNYLDYREHSYMTNEEREQVKEIQNEINLFLIELEQKGMKL